MKKNLSNQRMFAGTNTLASKTTNFAKTKVEFAPESNPQTDRLGHDSLNQSKKAFARTQGGSKEFLGSSSMQIEQELASNKSEFRDTHGITSKPESQGQGRLSEFREEDEQVACMRFPHKKFCGCEHPCYEREIDPRFHATQVGSMLSR